MANPTKDMLWYPNFTCQSNYISHECIALFLHYIPAYTLDFIARILGKPQRLVKISSLIVQSHLIQVTRRFISQVRFYDKAHKAIDTLSFYLLNSWCFVSVNTIRLSDQLSAIDRSTFYFDVREINWPQYITDYVLGIRRFILKDDYSTLPVAKRNLKRYQINETSVPSSIDNVFSLNFTGYFGHIMCLKSYKLLFYVLSFIQ